MYCFRSCKGSGVRAGTDVLFWKISVIPKANLGSLTVECLRVIIPHQLAFIDTKRRIIRFYSRGRGGETASR